MQQFGSDALIEKVFEGLGKAKSVYLTYDCAEGKTGKYLDLVVVGQVDKVYMHELIQKAEPLLSRRIRVAVFNNSVDLPEWNTISKIKLI